MKNRPLISAIMPVYNGENYIAEALESIRRQNYSPLEIIIVDDGSTDGTAAIVESFGDDIQLVGQANSGQPAAINRGLTLCKGEFIAIIDHDDIWAEDKLARQLAFLEAHPQIEIVCGRAKYFGAVEPWKDRLPLDEDQAVLGFKFGGTLIRRQAFEQTGLLDESMTISNDYEWYLRARDMGVSMRVTDDIVLYYRVHPESMTNTNAPRNFQLTRILKQSLDRRRQAGQSELPLKLTDMRD